MDLFLSSDQRKETPTLLDPLERTNLVVPGIEVYSF
jgi:hypothetical protein